jgi:hypothetical protein
MPPGGLREMKKERTRRHIAATAARPFVLDELDRWLS